MASGPITSWEIDGETVGTVSDLIFWGSKITAVGDCRHEIPLINTTGKLTLLLMLGRKAHVHAPIGDEDDSPVETPVVPQDPCSYVHCSVIYSIQDMEAT